MTKYIIHLDTDRSPEEIVPLQEGLKLWGRITMRVSQRNLPYELKTKERNAEMRRLYEENPKENSVGKLGERYGISRERVCQVLRKTNTISTVQERRSMAKKALAKEVKAAKVEAKRIWNAELQKALKLVREGTSLREAVKQSGIKLHSNFANELGKLVRVEGVELKHGRWRDFSERKARLTKLREKGYSWKEVLDTMHHEGDPVYYGWIIDNMPELITPRSRTKKPDVNSHNG